MSARPFTTGDRVQITGQSDYGMKPGVTYIVSSVNELGYVQIETTDGQGWPYRFNPNGFRLAGGGDG